MPASNVVPFPRRPRRPRMVRDDAYKRTVRFALPAHGIVPLGLQGEALIANARATAAQYRKLAQLSDKATRQARLLGFADKWDKRADSLEEARRGPQKMAPREGELAL